MRRVLSALCFGASLLAAPAAFALTVETHSTTAPDGSSQFVDPDDRLQQPFGVETRSGQADNSFGWHDNQPSHSNTPFSFSITGGGREGGGREAERDSPYYGMAPGSGFRNLNQ